MRVLGISGSLRRDSHNSGLLRAAASLTPPGAELVVFDRLREIPPFDQDDESDPPESVRDLRDQIAASDGVLISTPEYNGTIPGQLKNALDWASRPAKESVLRNKPAAVIGASPGQFGAVWAQAATRDVLSHIGARVIDEELAVAGALEAFAQDGSLLDGELSDRLRQMLGELQREALARGEGGQALAA